MMSTIYFDYSCAEALPISTFSLVNYINFLHVRDFEKLQVSKHVDILLQNVFHKININHSI